MYYTGTKQQVESYNQTVSNGEGYSGVTIRWAEPIKHISRDEWAIVKNPKYTDSQMTEVESLPSDWFETAINNLKSL